MKILKALAIVLLLNLAVLACGAPHQVSGRVYGVWTSVFVLVSEVNPVDGVITDPLYVTRTNQMGYFSFPDPFGACPEVYQVDVVSKYGNYDPMIFVTTGTGEPIFLNINSSN